MTELANENAGSFYSLSDVKSFLSQLPLLAALLSFSLFVLILWVYSFVLSRKAKENRAKLIFHGVFGCSRPARRAAYPAAHRSAVLSPAAIPHYGRRLLYAGVWRDFFRIERTGKIEWGINRATSICGENAAMTLVIVGFGIFFRRYIYFDRKIDKK